MSIAENICVNKAGLLRGRLFVETPRLEDELRSELQDAGKMGSPNLEKVDAAGPTQLTSPAEFFAPP